MLRPASRLVSSASTVAAATRAPRTAAGPSCRALHASAVDRALSKFVMPAMSPTMTEGGISTWQKKEGDTFAPGDVLLEIETDKATMDVEAQDEGKLVKIVVGDGTKGVAVGKVIAITGEEGDEADQGEIDRLSAEDDAAPAKSDDAPKDQPKKGGESSKKPAESKDVGTGKSADSEPKSTSSAKEPAKGESPNDGAKPAEFSTKPLFASPIAKKIALDRGIPLSQVKGTGPNGRILKKDVEEFKGGASAATASSGPSTSAAPIGAPAPTTPTKGDATTPPYTDTPVSNMRRVIASRLSESKNTAPHYYITAEVQMDRLMKLREVFNQAAGSEGVKAGTKLSVNDFIVKAVAVALQEVPEVNSAWLGDSIRQYHRADIAIAVSTPTGLLTPIVTDVGAKGLATISAQAKALAGKAREGKLQPAEYQGGSFTVSNLGMAGTAVHSFTAIINAPQSCILAVAGTEQKLVLDPESERGFKAVSVMKVTLSCDHRTVDGAVGSRWMKAFKDVVENPLAMML